MHANNNRGHRKAVTTSSSSTKPPNSSDESELFSYRDVAIYGAGLLAAGVGLYVARYKTNSGSNKRIVNQNTVFADAASADAAEKELRERDEEHVKDLTRISRILDEMSKDTDYDEITRSRFKDLKPNYNNEIPDNLQLLLDANQDNDDRIKGFFQGGLITVDST